MDENTEEMLIHYLQILNKTIIDQQRRIEELEEFVFMDPQDYQNFVDESVTIDDV